MYSTTVLSMCIQLIRLSCRQRIFKLVNVWKSSDTLLSWLAERSSLIRLMHLAIVCSSQRTMFVPANMSSFKLVGSLMNSLICNSSYPFGFIADIIDIQDATLILFGWITQKVQVLVSTHIPCMSIQCIATSLGTLQSTNLEENIQIHNSSSVRKRQPVVGIKTSRLRRPLNEGFIWIMI